MVIAMQNQFNDEYMNNDNYAIDSVTNTGNLSLVTAISILNASLPISFPFTSKTYSALMYFL